MCGGGGGGKGLVDTTTELMRVESANQTKVATDTAKASEAAKADKAKADADAATAQSKAAEASSLARAADSEAAGRQTTRTLLAGAMEEQDQDTFSVRKPKSKRGTLISGAA